MNLNLTPDEVLLLYRAICQVQIQGELIGTCYFLREKLRVLLPPEQWCREDQILARPDRAAGVEP